MKNNAFAPLRGFANRKNNSCQDMAGSLKTLPFIPQIRGWARFVWSLTPWSQEVLNVMA
jgi:hypothetical protein